MSRNFTANQYEYAYLAHKLGNWETPAKDKVERCSNMNTFRKLKSRTGRTQFIVDDNGHLLNREKKLGGTSFNTGPQPVHMHSKKQWPEENPNWTMAPASTMGYKGNITDYLPHNTVHIKTVEIPGCREFDFTHTL